MSKNRTTIGIQGGRGSFNETAIRMYLSDKNSTEYKILYLNTTPLVLSALHKSEIQLGQFAIYNTIGGLYEESLYAIGEYTFKIIDKYPLKISHSLMICKDVEFEQIDTIITHQQVMKQCEQNLSRKYSHLKLQVGRGEHTDPAKVAQELANGKLPGNVAVVSNKLLAEVYDLKIVENELEDNKNNESTFLLVAAIKTKRPDEIH